jgi:Rieske Fe-S protein
MGERRRFLNTLLSSGIAATAASIFYPILQFMMPPETVESAEMSVSAGRTDEIPSNSGKIFKFGAEPGLLIRTADGDLRAFSARCTHLNCTVQYDPGERLIICACHNGQFDLTGKNIGGPPPRPLEAYKVNVRGEEIVVSRV